MTKVLVISDVHANITALEAVLADAGKVNEVWCLGDIAGYGPDPNECIERIQALPKLTCMMGNHDYGAIAIQHWRHSTSMLKGRCYGNAIFYRMQARNFCRRLTRNRRWWGVSPWCTAARVTRSGNM